MKKVAIIVLIVFVFTFLLVNLATARNEDDLQAIKKAVKKNPEYEEIRHEKGQTEGNVHMPLHGTQQSSIY